MTSGGPFQSQPCCDMKVIAVEIEFRMRVPDLSAKGNLVLSFFFFLPLMPLSYLQKVESSICFHLISILLFLLQEVLGSEHCRAVEVCSAGSWFSLRAVRLFSKAGPHVKAPEKAVPVISNDSFQVSQLPVWDYLGVSQREV